MSDVSDSLDIVTETVTATKPKHLRISKPPHTMATAYINGAPHQSHQARFPGITHAAADLGVTRAHLWAVLAGKRESKPLLARWKSWLKAHPEFARLQRKA